MKKILLVLILLTTPCYAGQISLGTVSSDISVVNTNFTTLANVINGNVEGSTDSGSTVSNIKAASVFDLNMGADASPSGRAKELFGNTVDTFSSGTLTQGTFVYSGCVPATDSDLTSDISACVAYVNGVRISKGATSQTYSASMDTYVDLSQSGVYNISPVALGATQPAVAANSARIAKVVTDGTAITTVTDLARRSLPGLVVPSDYRVGMIVSKDSTTTITIGAGQAEINGSMITKSTPTTLTISTAGDWAGGSSLRAASTYGYVGLDSSGTLKLHTTAPAYENYAVSVTAGKKRYATWSATVYRILGWFYMDGAQLVENASNIKEGDVANVIVSQDTNVVAAFASTSFDTDNSKVNFYSSGGPLALTGIVSGDTGGSIDAVESEFFRGTTAITGSGGSQSTGGAGKNITIPSSYLEQNRPQGTVTYNNRVKMSGSTLGLRRRYLQVEEK